MDIDLMIRNWSLTFQYTKQFTQLVCTADLITGLHAEQLTEPGLKNLICDIKPVSMSIKNYVITEVTANMAGYKATDACLSLVCQFYSQRPFVVLAQLVEIQPFPTSATLTGKRTSQNIPLSHVTDFCVPIPKDARATIYFENPCYQNILTTGEFEDALTIPRNTATRRLNLRSDLSCFIETLQYGRNSNGALTFGGLDIKNQNISVELIGAPIYQGETDSFYNVDTSGMRPPPPILCTVHDTFRLFSPAAGGSCIYDTNHSFDEVIGPLSA
ncbi:MAG: hypothetical protein EZS28_001433 [Streblomastix strix]|uniref:Uncharacterized protein n=1 Tax=Streblomastix strix TaxID=222440 RepID=A0A5J4X738_9EUKA|nr:MAG: hypothetical protein EZS28_001433 [Streblomastix strix]